MKFYLKKFFLALTALSSLSLSATPMDPQYTAAGSVTPGSQTVRLWILESSSPKGNVTLLRILNELEKYVLHKDPENCCGLRPYIDGICGLGEAQSVALFYLCAPQAQSSLPSWSTEDLLYYFDAQITCEELLRRQAPAQEEGMTLLAPDISQILEEKLQPIQNKLQSDSSYESQYNESELIESAFGFNGEDMLSFPSLDLNEERKITVPFNCLEKKALYSIRCSDQSSDAEQGIKEPFVRYTVSTADPLLEGDMNNRIQSRDPAARLGLEWNLNKNSSKQKDFSKNGVAAEADLKRKIMALVHAHILENPAKLQFKNNLKVELFYLCAHDGCDSTVEQARHQADTSGESFNTERIQCIPAVVSTDIGNGSSDIMEYVDNQWMYIGGKEWQLEDFFKKIKQLPPLSPEFARETALARLQASTITSNAFPEALSLELKGLPLKNTELCEALKSRLLGFSPISRLELNRCKLKGPTLQGFLQSLTAPLMHPLTTVRIADESSFLSSQELTALIQAWNTLNGNRPSGSSFEVESLNSPTVIGSPVIDQILILPPAPAPYPCPALAKKSKQTFVFKNTGMETGKRALLQEANRNQGDELSDFIPEKKTLILYPKK